MKKIILALTATTILATAAFASGGNPGQGFLENWDYDLDGQVTVEEAAERRGDIFYTFDENEDDILTAEEYLYFDEARALDHEGEDQGQAGKGNPERKAAVGMTLEFNDVDGDGQVTREEFVTQTAAWIALIDRNGDGIVTTDDFGRQ